MQYLNKYISIVAAFIFVGIIKSSPLASQISFILAAVIVFGIIYIVSQKRAKTYNTLFSGSAVEIFFISTITLFMIEITGGPDSALYFLNYFLLFGLPLISTPFISLIFTASLMLFYIPDLVRDFNTDIILKLGSVLLLLPLSYFLSNELMKKQRENKKIKEEAESIQEAAEDLEANEDDINARAKLDQIIDSAQKLEDE